MYIYLEEYQPARDSRYLKEHDEFSDFFIDSEKMLMFGGVCSCVELLLLACCQVDDECKER